MSTPTLDEAVEWGAGRIGALSLTRGRHASTEQTHLAVLVQVAREVSAPSVDTVELVARIILGPKSNWNYDQMKNRPLSDWPKYPDAVRALAKARAVLAALSGMKGK